MTPDPAPLPRTRRPRKHPVCRLRVLAALLPVLTLALLLSLPVARAAGARGGARSPGAHDTPSPTETALLRQLKSSDPQQRLAALHGLAKQGDQAAVPAVVVALRDAEPSVRNLAEQVLWAIWSRSGNPEVDATFRIGTNLLQEGLDAQAVEVFTRVIHRAPDFAEAYNKRATAYYEMGAYHRSLRDIAEVLKRNPYHFGALAGAGLCLVELGRLGEAVLYFDRALKINPNLDGIRQLKRTVEQHLHEPTI